MNHDKDYPAEYLAGILKEVKTIAMVGASPDPTKFSYGVLQDSIHETGYDMIPVNPKQAGGEIRGVRVYPSLSAIDRPVDMVEIPYLEGGLCRHRGGNKDPRQGHRMQIGVRDDEAARLAEAADPEGGDEPLPEYRVVSAVLETPA